jgi:hypothetical protein
VYRESLLVKSQGTVSNRITVEAYGSTSSQSNVVAIKASDVVSNWTSVSNSIWKVSPWYINSQQVFVHPVMNLAVSDGYHLQQLGMPSSAMYNGTLPNYVFHVGGYTIGPTIIYGIGSDTISRTSYNADGTVNGTNYLISERDALSYMAGNPGTFFYSPTNNTLYIRLSDSSAPSNHLIEVSTRNQTLNATDSAIHRNNYYTFRNLRFRHGNGTATMDNNNIKAGYQVIYQYCDIQWGDGTGVVLQDDNTADGCIINNNGVVGCLGGRCTLKNCQISYNNYRYFYPGDTAGGVKFGFGLNSVATNNNVVSIEDCEVNGNINTAGVWFDTQLVSTPSIIRNNYIHNNGLAGILLECSSNIYSYNNVVVSNVGECVTLDGSSACRVWNNTLVGAQAYAPNIWHNAVSLYADPRTPTACSNSILNNLFLGTVHYYYANSWICDISVSSNAKCYGNVVDYNCYYGSDGTMRASYNGTQYGTFSTWKTVSGFDTHSFVANPLLASSTASSYILSSTSPCVDVGYVTDINSNPTDFTGVSRCINGVNDIGAFEYWVDANGNGIDDREEQ